MLYAQNGINQYQYQYQYLHMQCFMNCQSPWLTKSLSTFLTFERFLLGMDVSASITKITAHDVSYLTDNGTLFSDVLFVTIQMIKNYINLICKSANHFSAGRSFRLRKMWYNNNKTRTIYAYTLHGNCLGSCSIKIWERSNHHNEVI